MTCFIVFDNSKTRIEKHIHLLQCDYIVYLFCKNMNVVLPQKVDIGRVIIWNHVCVKGNVLRHWLFLREILYISRMIYILWKGKQEHKPSSKLFWPDKFISFVLKQYWVWKRMVLNLCYSLMDWFPLGAEVWISAQLFQCILSH